MSTPRRRLIRPAASSPATGPQRERRVHKLRARLDRERTALTRWQKRLKRAFNATAKCQQKIIRIERELARLED